MEANVQYRVEYKKKDVLHFEAIFHLLASCASSGRAYLQAFDGLLADLAREALLHPASLSAVGSLEAVHEVLLEAIAMNVLDGAFAAAGSG